MDQIEEAVENIKRMKIRGAGRIARYAVKTLKQVVLSSSASDVEGLNRELDQAARRLLDSRPTAVSLPNSIRYLMHHAQTMREKGINLTHFKESLKEKANKFIEDSEHAVEIIGRIGSRRIHDGDTIMTHCNSTVVVEILRQAHKAGKRFEIYVTETRPRFQGRLTAESLMREGISPIFIIDSAMRYFMNEVDTVLVGADAIAVNGAVVNKIGTSLMALAANEARTTFLVAAESYKFSPETVLGELIWIEERDLKEITRTGVKNPLLKIRNPSFDVTPPEYVDAIITEKGVIPPQASFWVLQEMLGTLTVDELSSYQTFHPQED